MTRIRARSLRSQEGYNLIEAAIVLGVAGLIIAGVFAAWGAVNSQNKLRRAQDQITVIVNQIRSTYGNRTQLDNTANGGAFTNALVDAGLLPDSWITNTTTKDVGNPYGGTIVVTPASMPASSNKDAFKISFSRLNQPDCYKLASNMVGTGRTQGLTKIGSATVTASSTFSGTGGIQGNVCTNANGSNTLDMTFSLKMSN